MPRRWTNATDHHSGGTRLRALEEELHETQRQRRQYTPPTYRNRSNPWAGA